MTLTLDTDARRIGIDFRGAAWAHHLGRCQRLQTLGVIGIKADRWCPFREGTRHRTCWYAGWRNQPISDVLPSVGLAGR